jgi:hypothetical protein
MNEMPQLLLRISQRFLARQPAWTARHAMKVRHHRKNDCAGAEASGHNNQIAVGARQSLDHWSDVALQKLVALRRLQCRR